MSIADAAVHYPPPASKHMRPPRHCTGHCFCPRGNGCGPVYVALRPSTRGTAVGTRAWSVCIWKDVTEGGGGLHCSRPSANEPRLTSEKLWAPQLDAYEDGARGTAGLAAPAAWSTGGGMSSLLGEGGRELRRTLRSWYGSGAGVPGDAP